MVEVLSESVSASAPSSSAAGSGAASDQVLILRLHDRPNITWTDDTVDNEHLGRKSSKRCCIFHKVKKFAESDSDESDEEGEGGGEQGGGGEGGGGEGGQSPGAAGGAGAKGGTNRKAPIKNYQRHHA